MGCPSEKYHLRFLKTVFLLGIFGLALGCSSRSEEDASLPGEENPVEDTEAPMTDDTEAGDSTETTDSTDTDTAPGTVNTVSFTVIGDVPYNEGQRDSLTALIDAHNAQTRSEFVVHVGDIKPGSDACDENVYEDVSGLLRKLETPTFIVLGDNEFNDCPNPEDALVLWNQYFLGFNKNWDFTPEVAYQKERPENFAWVENDVLFMGLNLVGSSVHDEAEWNRRLSNNADWVEAQLSEKGESIGAAVLFGHANMTEIGPEKFEPFTDRFRAAAETFAKPVLYLHGDGHFWFKNRPWPERNILRVQIQGGGEAVRVTVDTGLEEPFVFERDFL